MATASKKSRRVVTGSPAWTRRTLALALALVFPVGAVANGTDPRVTAGAAQFIFGKKSLDVINSPGTVIEWKSFSIQAGEITRFIQQNASSAVMNRITGGDPTLILGTLQSNGRVFLINQNGIAFGASAQVNVAGLVASTLNLSDADFRSGRLDFGAARGAVGIENKGMIRALPGGQVILVAPTVENRGVIEAPDGQIVLAAGRSANLIDPLHPEIQVEVRAEENAAVNIGRLAGGAVGIYAGAIRHSGQASANTAVLGEGGRIVFKAVGDLKVEAGATVDASGTTGGGIRLESGQETRIAGNLAARGAEGGGGFVRVLGDRVALEDGARIEAGGRTAGGDVLVGGEFQGRGGVPNAARTYVAPGASIDASAGEKGNGGRVVVWSDEATGYYGRITAKGGAKGGDGGFVEVSGKAYLDYRGSVDLSAKGRTGTLLLDPDSLDIGAVADIDGLGTSADLTLPILSAGDYSGVASRITAASVVLQLNSADVVLQAVDNITVSAAIDASANPNSHGLSLQATGAAGSVILNESVRTKNGAIAVTAGTGGVTQAAGKTLDAGSGTITLSSGGGNLVLAGGLSSSNATAGAVSLGGVDMQIGNMSTGFGGVVTATLSGVGTQTAGTSISGATALNKSGAGTLTLSETNTYVGGTTISGGTLEVSGGAALADTAQVVVGPGATLALLASETVGSLAGSGTVSLGANTLTSGGPGTTSAFSGSIGGAGGIVKLGIGTLTLSGTNTFTGPADVQGGNLTLNGGNAIADTAPVSVAAGANLILGANETIGSLAGAGTVSLGARTLTTGGDGSTTTFSGTISGSGGLTKTGAGTLTLSGANSYGGLTDVQAGTLALGASDVLDDSSTLKVSGGTLDIGTNSDTVAGVQLTGGSITGTTGVLSSTTDFDMQSGSVSAKLGGGVGLVKSTGGTVTLSGGNSYGGLTDVQAGTLALGASDVLDDTSTLKVSGGTLDIGTNSDTVAGVQLTGGSITGTTGVLSSTTDFDMQSGSVSAKLGGGVGLVKSTGGTVTLSGGNSYGGLTDVQAGTLALGASDVLDDTSTLKVSGGTLDIGTNSDTVAGVQLTGGSITGTTGVLSSTTDFDMQSGSVSAKLGGGVGLVKSTGGTVTLSGGNSYGGLTDVQAGTLALGASDVLDDTSTLKVSGGTLDIGTNSDTVAGVQLTGGSITGTTGVLSSTTDFDMQSGSVSAKLGGGVGLVKSTGGTVTLSGGNSYGGLTDVQAGTLALGASDVLDDSSTLKVSGGTLDIGTNSDTVAGVQLTGGSITGTTGVLSSTTDFDMQSGSVSAKLGGGVGLVKSTGGTVTLSGGNSYGGLTDVQAGTLALGASGVLDDASTLAVAAGATLDLNNHSDTVASVASGGLLTGTGGATLTATTYTLNGGTVDIDLGAGSLTQASGTTTLNGVSGATTIDATGGTLLLGAANRLSNSAVVTIAAGATLDLAGFNDTVGSLASGGTLAGSGTLTASTYTLNGGSIDANLGAGTLTQSAGTTTLNGAAAATTVHIDGGTLRLGAANRLANTAAVTLNGGTLDIGANNDIVGVVTLVSGAIDGTSGVLTGTSYAVQSGSVGAILGGSGNLTKTTAGTVTLGNANTYTGTTTVSAGTLAMGTDAALGSGTDVVVNGGNLDIATFNPTVAGVQLASGSISGTSGVLESTTNFDLRSGTASAALGGAVGAAKTTAGAVVLSGANTYTGTTTVSAGTLTLNGGAAIADAAAVTVASGATLALGADETVASIAGAGAVNLGSSTLTTAGGGTTFSGVISGSGGLTLTGSTFILSGANLYTGLTDVQGGILTLNGGAAIADAAAVQVALGATVQLGANETIGSLAGAGDVGLGTRTLTTGGSGASTLHTGVISGTGGITKQGSGTFTLGGGNSYTGTTLVQVGTLALGASDVLADTAAVTVNGGALDIAGHDDTVGAVTLILGSITGTSGALTGAAYAMQSGTVDAILTGGAAMTKTTAGTVTLAGNNTFAGGTTISGGTLVVTHGNGLGLGAAAVDASAAAATLDLRSVSVANDISLKNGAGTALLTAGTGAAGGAGQVTLIGGGRLSAAAGATLTMDGKVTGVGGLTVAGPGTVILTNGTNDYTAGTTVGAGALLAVTDPGALGAAATSVATGGLLDLRNTGLVALSSTVNLNGGTVTASTGTSTLGDVVIGAAGSTLSAAAGAQLAGGGIVTDPGSHGFTASGAGGVSLSNAANDFGGTVTLSAGTVDLVDHNAALLTLLLAGAGNTTVSSTGAGGMSVSGTALGSLDLTATAGIGLIGDVATAGGQTFHSPVTLSANVTLTAPSVDFAGSVNGARTLSIAGDVHFSGAVGAGSALTSLSVSGASALDGGSIRTTGNQDFNGAVTLGADAHLTAANIRFFSAVDGPYALQLTGSGRFDAAVGGVVPLASLSVSGATRIGGGSIATTGVQAFTGAVTLAADTLLTASTAGFGAAVDGAHDLGIFGDASFGGLVGAGTPLSSLSVAGASTFSGGGATTSGSQTYTGPVTLAANTTLRGTGIQFSDTVDGNRDLVLDAGAGDIGFGGALGGISALASLTVDDARNVDFAGAVHAGSFTQTTGTGATTLDVAISTSGSGGIAIANHDVFLTPGGSLATADAPVSLAADGSLGFSGGTISAGAGAVTFGVMTPGTAMTFGAGPGLNIGGAAMSAVSSASAVRLGNAATGDLLIAAALANPGATDVVALVSGGNITQSAPITVTNLRVSATGDVILTDPGNGFTNLAGSLTGAAAFLDVRTAGSLNVGTVDGVAGLNSPGPATASSPDVRIQVGGSLTQSAAIVADELTVRAPAGSISLLHNHGGGLPPDNDVLSIDALALGSVAFVDGNGYKVNGAVGNGLHFDSLGTIDFSALLAGDNVNIDAGSGDLVINSAGSISITGPGRLHGRNILLTTPDTQDITLSGGVVAGISNDVIVSASANLTIQTRDLTVAGGTSTAGPGQSLKNDAILQAGGTLSITTSGDFTIQGGTVATTSGAGGNAAGQANAFVQAPNLSISVGGDLLIKGGDIQADSSAGGTTRNDASGILLIGNAKDIRVGGNMVVAGGSSSVFLGSRNTGSALAVLDPEVPMTITTGGSLALIGGSAKPGITSSASIFNAGPITLDVRGRGTFTDTYRGTGAHPAGLLLIGGSGSGRFDLNDDPVLTNDYPVKYLLGGGSYTVITGLRGGDAYIQSRAPIGIDSSLLGYIFFAINNETQTRGKRSIVDQATPERSQAGQCK